MKRPIYEVRSVSHAGRTHHWGATTTRETAEQRMAERFEGNHADWAAKHHARWWVEAIETDGLFEFPSKPAPRERFTANEHEVPAEPGYGATLEIEVAAHRLRDEAPHHQRHDGGDGDHNHQLDQGEPGPGRRRAAALRTGSGSH